MFKFTVPSGGFDHCIACVRFTTNCGPATIVNTRFIHLLNTISKQQISCGSYSSHCLSAHAGKTVYPSARMRATHQTPNFICTRAGLPETSLTVEQPLIPSTTSTRADSPVFPLLLPCRNSPRLIH